MTRLPPAHRAGRLVATALLAGVGISTLVFAVADWHLHDMEVYLSAARRIRDGQALYGGEVDPLSAYRYAPWFAYVWVPLSYLPELAVRIGWSAILVAASLVAMLPSAQRSRWRLVLLFAPILIGISAIGNVQPGMIALLVWGLSTRWGGLAVGVAASLKLVPILLVFRFIAERRWSQVAVAVAVTAVLWLPVLWYDVAPVSFDPGIARTLPVTLWAPVALMAIATAAFLAQRRSAYSTLAAATAALLALPRLFVYEVTLVLVGAVPSDPAAKQDTVDRA